MFYLNVAKVDLDVAYTCMLQAYVQVFLGVSYIYLQVFYLDVAYVCDGFQVCFRRFSQVFQMLVSSVSSFLFCMLQLVSGCVLYVTTVVSGCFKSRSGVAHVIRMGSGWRRGRCLGWREPTADALARSCVGTIQTLEPGSDVRALASPFKNQIYTGKY
jgi:hypothetical protein